MASKFHRWWLGSCVAALLLASWAGGFSVAVTAVFIVIYLTGMTLVGPEDVADIGLATDDRPAAEPTAAPVAPPEPELQALDSDEDAEPYPDDDEDAEPSSETAAVIVESADPVDTTAVVETAVEQEPDEPEPGPT